MFDGEAFGQQMVDIVRGYVASEIEPLRAENKVLQARIDTLEQREAGMAREQVMALVGERGPELVGLSERIAELEARPLPELPDVKAMVLDEVTAAVAAIPAPKDGAPGERGERGEPGSAGVDIADLVRGENGHIIATLSNGVTRDLGSFKGEKGDTGERGLPGEPGQPGERGPAGEQGPAGEKGDAGLRGEQGPAGDAGPAGEKGDPGEAGPAGERGDAGPAGDRGEKGDTGERGRDGLGLENLHVEQDGRNVTLILRAGEEEAEFNLYFPVPLYEGVYRPEQAYKSGDMVTYGGSVWHCDRDSKRAPNIANDEWTLCVKQGDKGRPGKDAADKGLGE